MRKTHVNRTVARLVEVELRPLMDLADERAVRDAGRYAATSLELGGPHIQVALKLAVLGLDTLTVLRLGSPFSKARREPATAWWNTLRGYPGFAQLRQLVRTPAMLLFSERIHIDRRA